MSPSAGSVFSSPLQPLSQRTLHIPSPGSMGVSQVDKDHSHQTLSFHGLVPTMAHFPTKTWLLTNKTKTDTTEASPVLPAVYPSRRARSWLVSHEMRVVLATTANVAAKCTITCLCGSTWEQQPFARGSCCQVRSAASFITPASSCGRHQAVHLGPASFFPSPPDSLHNHVWALQRLTSRADVLLLCIMQFKINQPRHTRPWQTRLH